MVRIQTAHFGEIEFDMGKKFYFECGLPGLEEDTEFALLSQDKSEPVCWLQSLIHPEVALPVMNPFVVCPTYAFDIVDSDIDKLQIIDVKDVCVLNVLVIPKGDPRSMRINLSAPIIINMKNRQGRQIFLNDKCYSTKMQVSDLIAEAAVK